jgi:hypothetical protein
MEDPKVKERLEEILGDGPPSPSVLFDFEDVLEATKLVESAIEAKGAKEAAEHMAHAREIASNPMRSFLEELPFTKYAQKSWRTNFALPTIGRGSLLVAITSHLEGVLRLWCDALREVRRLAPVTFPTSKSKLDAYLEYLEKIAALPINGYEEWEEFKKAKAYMAVRNCIVHEAWVVTSDLRNFELISAYVGLDNSGLLMAAEKVVHLRPGACEDAAKTAKSFLDRISRSFEAREIPPPPDEESVGCQPHKGS